MKKPFLTVYGHITVDQIMSLPKFPGINETVDILEKHTSLGGTGPNIALTAARLGVPTALCGFVGIDFPPRFMQEMLDAQLITNELLTLDQYESSVAMVFNDRELKQKVVFYQGPQGSASQLNIDLLDNARQSEFVHFCTGDPDYYLRLMEKLDGKPYAVDPSQETYRFWPAHVLKKALAAAGSLFCNNYEAEVIEERLGLNSVLDLDLPLVVRTDGAEGSVAKIAGEPVRIPCVAGGPAVDATGCGDAYRAGYYAGRYHGYAVHESLVLAAATASFVIEKFGALTNTPTWTQLLRRAKPYLEAL